MSQYMPSILGAVSQYQKNWHQGSS